MARAKKETALTPEERLQAASVPDWEWPYKLPENWCWVKASAVARIYTGNSISEKIKADKYAGQQEGLLFIATKDIGFDNAINYETDIRIPDYPNFKIAPANTALLCIEGGSAGRKVGFVNREVCFGNKLCVFAAEKVNSKFIYYILQSQYFIQQFNNRKHGLIGGVSVSDLAEIGFPLSPLAEQQRIVDRIESLFVKLDEAKEKAQAVVDSFETRKAAILHKAFTGELTAKWREEHGVLIDNWKTTRFDSVAAIRSNLVDPAEYQSFPHIAPDNIEKKTGVLLEYHTIAEDGVTSGKHRFYSGQILYSKIRPYLSKAVVVDFDGLCSADMYPIEAYQNARCLWYYMLSDEFLLQASTAGSRSVLPKINQKELSALTVHLPTNDREQEEIARILDELFDKEQQTKEAAEAVLDQINLMKKSILARAFRGELGTNDPSEESAVELLKRVL